MQLGFPSRYGQKQHSMLLLGGCEETAKKLVENMAPEALVLADFFGQTALHIAAGANNIEAAKLLVEKNLKLSNVQDFDGYIPLHYAAAHGNREMVLYLSDVIREDAKLKPLINQQLACHQSISLSGFDCFGICCAVKRPNSMGNHGLHWAGWSGPQQRLSLRVSAVGAALQMQRELQCYELNKSKFIAYLRDVKLIYNTMIGGGKNSTARDKEMRNTSGMTPAEVFTDAQRELVKEGERWMKDTATSCTIVVALVASVVFAAAISVPVGNNINGHPIFFFPNRAFVNFGISDVFALFSSVTSVLMFLSILTAHTMQSKIFSMPYPRA
ncbi:hypothetical protein TEA_018980 [Camellia sinensis var. sinensis]|uniref:PGG domain-containing protein n=1 Tax=Camellia sinensis var. sinensis TaxID=542762 RepID=A0A4S4DPL6_CAMSN|nr:hypothetical protein TEA_018980 [Camellia sinensis var. sinensis]